MTPVQNAVNEAIASRKSVRSFLDTPVEKSTLENILQVSSRAPSGNNAQPWSVEALTGAPLKQLTDKLVEEAMKMRSPQAKPSDYEYDYYPEKWIEPFLARRRKVGFDLYAKLGITKENLEGRQKQFEENYRFFGAPVGLLIFIDRSMGRGGLIDCGMFIENILIAARGLGLDTCPQAAFSQYAPLIYQHLSIPDNRMLLCGIALGYANADHPANQLKTERVPPEAFAQFHGF